MTTPVVAEPQTNAKGRVAQAKDRAVDGMKQAAKAKATETATGLRRDVKSAVHRNRAQLAPWMISAPYAVLGEAAWAASAFGTGQPVALAAGVGATAAGASLLAWRKNPPKRLQQLRPLSQLVPKRFATRVKSGMAALCAWCTAAPMASMLPAETNYGMLLALVGGTAWAALPWWSENQHVIAEKRDTTTVALPAEVPHEEPDEAEVERSRAENIKVLWDTHVAARTGPVPGSRIEIIGEIDRGFAFRIYLSNNGQVTADSLSASSMKSRLALALGEEGVFASRITFRGTPERPDVVTMRITWPAGDNAYHGPIVLCDGEQIHSRDEITPGSNVDIVVGGYIDGEGAAVYRVISNGSVNSGFILGSIGSGKTLLVEHLIIGLRMIGVEIWYIDGQYGGSSPTIAAHAQVTMLNRPGDPERLFNMMDRAYTVRSKELAADPSMEGKYTYDPARPPVIAVVEECKDVFQAEHSDGDIIGDKFARLSEKYRKTGIGILAISQHLTVPTFGGGAEADNLRASLYAAGNVLVLRFTSKTGAGLLPVGCPNPAEIPGAGYGYAPMQQRGETLWRSPTSKTRPKTKAEWMTRWPAATLDVRTRKAAGSDYRTRDEQFDSDRDAVLAELAAIDAADEDADIGSLLNAGKAEPKPARSEHTPVSTGPQGQRVIVFPGQQPPQEAPAEEPTTPWSPRQQQILDLLTEAWTVDELAGELGVTGQTIRNDLNGLQAVVDKIEGKPARYRRK